MILSVRTYLYMHLCPMHMSAYNVFLRIIYVPQYVSIP